MRKVIPPTLLPAIAALLLSSCDGRYDLSKIDRTVNILQSIDLPVSTRDSLSLSEYANVNIGTISIDPDDIILNVPGGIPEQLYVDSVLPVQSFNLIYINQTYGKFPEWISGLQKIVCDTAFYRISFKISENDFCDGLSLREGFAIHFPEWISLKECSEPLFKLSENKRSLVLTADKFLPCSETWTIDFAIDEINFPAGAVTDAGLYVEGTLLASGDICIGKEHILHFPTTASTITIDISGSLPKYSLKSATLKLVPDKIPLRPVTEKILIDREDFSLYDAGISGYVENHTGIGFRIRTKLYPGSFRSPEDIVVQNRQHSDFLLNVAREDSNPFNKIDSVQFAVSVEDCNGFVTINRDDAIAFGLKHIHSDNGLFIKF